MSHRGKLQTAQLDRTFWLIETAGTMRTPGDGNRQKTGGDSRFISPEFLEANRDAIAVAMRANLRKWGAQGWRIVGQDPQIRIQVSVPSTVQRPGQPIRGLRIAGRTVKPSVISSHAQIRRERWANGSDPTAIGLAHAIAPGARIRAGRGGFQEFVGIAAVLVIDGLPKILTCGHAHAFSYSGELLAGDEPDGDAIATLERNFLEDSAPLDAALCGVTDAGLSVLKDSSAAPTWQFRKVRTPSAADNGKQSVFWQTHDGDDEAPTAPVESFNGENSALFGPQGPRGPFVETSHAVAGGDSGSLLSLGNSLYGLCSGFVGYTGFFTPIASVLARLNSEGIACSIYDPSAN